MGEKDKFIELSTGVKLRITRPSIWLLQEKSRQLLPKMPKPPIIHIEEKDRDEENPNDPEYKAALQQWVDDWGRTAENASLILGVIIESTPEGFSRPEDAEWADELSETFGIEIPAQKQLRYAAWLKLWACRTEDDSLMLAKATRQIAGVPEEEVDKAADSFRGGEEQPADLDASAEKQGDNGDHVRDDSAGGSAGV
jgi:hypothetical protein